MASMIRRTLDSRGQQNRRRGRRVVEPAVLSAIHAALDANVPVLIWGPPGTGKSETLKSLADQAGASMEIQVAGRMDPTDLGLLYPLAEGGVGQLRTLAPDWIIRLSKSLEAGKPTWLFLDEMSTATSAVLAGLLRLVQEREAGGIHLPGLRIVAAANPPSQAAGAGIELDAASADRWMHLRWTVDPTVWRPGFLRGWGKPQSDQRMASRALVAGYVSRHPQALGGGVGGGESAWPPGWGTLWGRTGGPSMRSWDAYSAVLASLVKLGFGTTAQAAALTAPGVLAGEGLLGSEAGDQFATFIRQAGLPDPEDVLAGKVEMPQREDQLAIAADALVAAALAHHKDRPKRVVAAFRLLQAIPLDIGLPAVRTLAGSITDAEAQKFPAADARAMRELLERARGAKGTA